MEARTLANTIAHQATEEHEPGAYVAARAGVRLAGWLALGAGIATPSVVASYDDPAAPLAWDASPALELIMMLEEFEALGLTVDRAALRRLPSALRVDPWRA